MSGSRNQQDIEAQQAEALIPVRVRPKRQNKNLAGGSYLDFLDSLQVNALESPALIQQHVNITRYLSAKETVDFWLLSKEALAAVYFNEPQILLFKPYMNRHSELQKCLVENKEKYLRELNQSLSQYDGRIYHDVKIGIIVCTVFSIIMPTVAALLGITDESSAKHKANPDYIYYFSAATAALDLILVLCAVAMHRGKKPSALIIPCVNRRAIPSSFRELSEEFESLPVPSESKPELSIDEVKALKNNYKDLECMKTRFHGLFQNSLRVKVMADYAQQKKAVGEARRFGVNSQS